MKKARRWLCIAMLMLAAIAIPAGADGCWYYDTYGCHAYEQVDAGKPTCTLDGYYLLECTICGDNHREITEPAYGHDWRKVDEVKATCTSRGSIEYECKNCHGTKVEKSERLSHEYGKWNTVRDAGELSPGLRYRVCAECGHADEEEFYPEGALYRGVKDRYAVMDMQQKLNDMGYLHDKVDGVFGKNTESAVEAYAADSGFPADGVAWPPLLDSLQHDWDVYMNYEPAEPDDSELEGNLLEDICICSGDGGWIMCADHSGMCDTEQALLGSAEDEYELLRAFKQVRALWQGELDALYDEWLSKESADDKRLATMGRLAFAGYMSAQQNAWRQLYGEDSLDALEREIYALKEQCMQLCSLAKLKTDTDGE